MFNMLSLIYSHKMLKHILKHVLAQPLLSQYTFGLHILSVVYAYDWRPTITQCNRIF